MTPYVPYGRNRGITAAASARWLPSVRLIVGLALKWALTTAFTAAAMTGTLAGGRLADRASPRQLSAAFMVLVVIVGSYTLARSVPGLAGHS